MSFRESVGDVWRGIRDYRSKKKIGLDSRLEPWAFFGAANALGWMASDKIMDITAQAMQNPPADEWQGAALLLEHAGALAALVAANKYVILPIKRKIGKYYRNQKAAADAGEREGHTAWSLLKTTAIGGAGLALLLNMGTPVKNTYETGKRVLEQSVAWVDAWARDVPAYKVPEQVRELEDVVEREAPSFPKIVSKNHEQDAGILAGMNIGKYTSRMTGIPRGVVPQETHVDFNEHILDLWKEKRGKSTNKQAIDEILDNQVRRYVESAPDKMSLDDFIADAQNEIEIVNSNIDWQRFGRDAALNDNELELVKEIAQTINGRDLVIYAMTEIAPSQDDGRYNRAMFEFILNNAGDMIYLIPAMADGFVSFGPYQFTSYALNGSTKQGASRTNLAIPQDFQLPGSVKELDGTMHHRAAYMFALSNLATIVNSLNTRQEAVLRQGYEANKEDVIKMIATAHNKPSSAIRATQRWLDHHMRHDFTVSCSKDIRDYAKRTRANYRELYGVKTAQRTPVPEGEKQKRQPDPVQFAGQFKDLDRINSQGKSVFMYTVMPGDTAFEIMRKFDQFDEHDIYATINPRTDVTDSRGHALGSRIKANQIVYILAQSN